MLIAPCSNFVKFNGCQRFGELHSRDVQKVDGSDSNEGNTQEQRQISRSERKRFLVELGHGLQRADALGLLCLERRFLLRLNALALGVLLGSLIKQLERGGLELLLEAKRRGVARCRALPGHRLDDVGHGHLLPRVGHRRLLLGDDFLGLGLERLGRRFHRRRVGHARRELTLILSVGQALLNLPASLPHLLLRFWCLSTEKHGCPRHLGAVRQMRSHAVGLR
mmetsp:Transcript_31796/g.66876  ORF Transcript_31796/g.66876 Transcript_31796/m.66876 type:complete len:223 (+) Transcript_31796:565-1233(+)